METGEHLPQASGFNNCSVLSVLVPYNLTLIQVDFLVL
jgi:hypothetical protein